MIYESTRKMTPNEQMAYDLGYNKAKAESTAQLAAVQAERDAANEMLGRYSALDTYAQDMFHAYTYCQVQNELGKAISSFWEAWETVIDAAAPSGAEGEKHE